MHLVAVVDPEECESCSEQLGLVVFVVAVGRSVEEEEVGIMTTGSMVLSMNGFNDRVAGRKRSGLIVNSVYLSSRSHQSGNSRHDNKKKNKKLKSTATKQKR